LRPLSVGWKEEREEEGCHMSLTRCVQGWKGRLRTLEHIPQHRALDGRSRGTGVCVCVCVLCDIPYLSPVVTLVTLFFLIIFLYASSLLSLFLSISLTHTLASFALLHPFSLLSVRANSLAHSLFSHTEYPVDDCTLSGLSPLSRCVETRVRTHRARLSLSLSHHHLCLPHLSQSVLSP